MQGKIGFHHSFHAAVLGEVRKKIFRTQLCYVSLFGFLELEQGFPKAAEVSALHTLQPPCTQDCRFANEELITPVRQPLS